MLLVTSPVNDFIPAPAPVDITKKLPTNPKGDWMHMPLRRADGSIRTGPREISEITHISVHHTAVEGGTPEGHSRFHIRKGDGGIAYHVYVNPTGIFQTNDLLALTWHTQSNNYHTIGIVVEGNFTKRPLSPSERSNLYAAIITVMKMFNIPVANVKGHREYPGTATSCPGFDMNQVRKDIAGILMEMEHRQSANFHAEAIVKLMTRMNSLYDLYAKKGEHADTAARKLMTAYRLMEEYDLLDPMKAGRTFDESKVL